MSWLVPELHLTLDRVLVVAPDAAQLKRSFEDITQAAMSDLGTGGRRKIRLESAAAPSGLVSLWTSLTLGTRAGSEVRVAFMGTTADAIEKHPGLLGHAEGIIIDAQEGSMEPWLKTKVPLSVQTDVPAVVWGLGNASTEEPFESKAARLWFSRNFSRLRLMAPFGGTKPSWLIESLEWVLSF